MVLTANSPPFVLFDAVGKHSPVRTSTKGTIGSEGARSMVSPASTLEPLHGGLRYTKPTAGHGCSCAHYVAALDAGLHAVWRQ